MRNKFLKARENCCIDSVPDNIVGFYPSSPFSTPDLWPHVGPTLHACCYSITIIFNLPSRGSDDIWCLTGDPNWPGWGGSSWENKNVQTLICDSRGVPTDFLDIKIWHFVWMLPLNPERCYCIWWLWLWKRIKTVLGSERCINSLKGSASEDMNIALHSYQTHVWQR